MAGYSGTPLWKKLGLKDGMAAAVLDPPDHYAQLLAGGPAATWGPPRDGMGFLHLFTARRDRLAETLPMALSRMARDGMIWISWPKKASKLPSEITEDVVREVALPMGLVDAKVCAVDEIWSGLKLVIRKELR
ncbi:DUF3052 family protein [Roseisalinus antarcticus]|uniref:DUF3052 domain-containing protein n=1 Tax=Roseisalinus antarcticus TaxID=254357 RepID=A0A1Y5SBW5_9RHOB|nr:DUF3052 family protein [Roseisalinus antarcticus]SLN36846.1 hypothetical protein ROA7023_01353 [Roseisalinus antarcticus]